MTALRWIRSPRAGALLLGLTLALGATATARAQEPKTIKPGMSEAEVRAAWGNPITVKKIGNMAYMYYNNDCLKTCGIHDVVFLENGQVVDAIVRDQGRRYDGVSSSPRDRKPEPTLPKS
ncbi:MAG TPA: hypothetical protein VNH46_08685 [Gemmatimonadales bacterium]|nr:hypothetical protein [Gemmatimonadales bacterium]